MPNRILRDGILTSAKLAKLNWAEEVFYRRLMSLVDDFGRYHASPDLLRAHAYPRQLNKVSDTDVVKWIGACQEAGLVSVYPAQDGERYLEIVNFGQQIRATKSKFPAPPAIDSKCLQVPSNEHLDVSVDEDVDEDDKTPRKRSDEPPDGVSDSVWQDFKKLRSAKKSPLTDTALQAIKREADKAGYTLEKALETCCARGWTGFKAEWTVEKPSPADVARQTVPSTPGRDPALIKAEEDAKRAAPIPESIRNQIAQLTRRAA